MNFLEDYHEKLQRHMTNLLEFNSHSSKNERQLEESIKKLMSSKSSMDVEERQQLISQFESNLQHGIQVAKGKLFVSNQAYDTVDKYIRRLDNDLNRFNISLARHKSEKGSNAERRDWKFRTGDMDLTSATGAGHASSMASRNRKANALLGTSTRGKTKNSGLTSDANTDDALFDEFPIDPNEPTYCLCNRVSFGEMVACDNDDCDIKWFHWDCIGMTTLPKGKWYCPNCSGVPLKKQRKR